MMSEGTVRDDSEDPIVPADDEMHVFSGGSRHKELLPFKHIPLRQTSADFMASVTPHCFPRRLAAANNTQGDSGI